MDTLGDPLGILHDILLWSGKYDHILGTLLHWRKMISQVRSAI